MIRSFFIVFIFSTCLLSQTNATPPNLSQRYLTLKSYLDYMSTSSNFDSEGGGIVDLNSGNSYSKILFRESLFYTFSSDFAFELGAEMAKSESVGTTDTRANTQLTEFQGKLFYQLKNRPFEIIPQLTLIVPFNKITSDTDDVLTGEGALQFGAGSWFVKEFGSLYFYLYLAYQYRDEGRSHLLPWRFGGEYDFSGFYIGAEAIGYESLTDDEFTNDKSQRISVTDRVNGGSLSFYSVNPQQMTLNSWISFDISNKTNLKFGFSQGINGRDSAVEQTVYAQVDLKINMSNNTPKESSKLENSINKKRLRQFKVEDDDYDESIFNKNYQRKQKLKKIRENELLNETEKLLEKQQ